MAVTHGIDELLHFEACFQITLGPMELDVAIGQKVNLACVRTIITLSTDNGVRLIGNCSKLKQCFVELGQSGQVVGANVHVVKLEFHSAFFRLGCELPTSECRSGQLYLNELGALLSSGPYDITIH